MATPFWPFMLFDQVLKAFFKLGFLFDWIYPRHLSKVINKAGPVVTSISSYFLKGPRNVSMNAL
jgi:hypothetical protein